MVFQAKRLIKELCEINMEMAKMLVSTDDNEKQLPSGFYGFVHVPNKVIDI
ncbi:MAG: hypothetical protein KAI50_11130 [Desulfobacterales bacterium]|nr:hypothetical protein [Desulfobacterales bacterium]